MCNNNLLSLVLNDNSIIAADKMNAGSIHEVGCGILILSLQSKFVSLKRDTNLYPPLSMATLPIDFWVF